MFPFSEKDTFSNGFENVEVFIIGSPCKYVFRFCLETLEERLYVGHTSQCRAFAIKNYCLEYIL